MEELDKKEIVITVSTGTTAVAAGAMSVFEALKSEIEERGLNVVLKKTGEKGVASSEPIIEVHRGGRTFVYGNMTPETAKTVVEHHIIEGTPIIDWLIDVHDEPQES